MKIVPVGAEFSDEDEQPWRS